MAITTINGRRTGTVIGDVPSPELTLLYTGTHDELPDKASEGDMAYGMAGDEKGAVYRYSESNLDWEEVESGSGSGSRGGVILVDAVQEGSTVYLGEMSYDDLETALDSGDLVVVRWGNVLCYLYEYDEDGEYTATFRSSSDALYFSAATSDAILSYSAVE